FATPKGVDVVIQLTGDISIRREWPEAEAPDPLDISGIGVDRTSPTRPQTVEDGSIPHAGVTVSRQLSLMSFVKHCGHNLDVLHARSVKSISYGSVRREGGP